MTRFEQVCRELLKTPIVVVDVGADGLVHDVDALTPLCEVHAIEPRQDSFEALQPANAGSRAAKTLFYNTGLAETSGRHTLFVTRVPQASSLRRPDASQIARWRDDGKLEVVAEIEVGCVTLAEFARTAGLTAIDIIKLDTQGTELEILLSGGDLLQHTSIVLSEVEFVPLYEGQSLFDDVVRELSTRGFRFVGFENTDIVDRKIIWADCVFVQRRFDDRARLLKAAMVLIEKGFLEDSRWLLADHGEPPEIWQRAIDARLSDQHGRSAWIANVNNTLKAITKNSRLLESLRVRAGQLLLRLPIGRAAYMIGRNRKT